MTYPVEKTCGGTARYNSTYFVSSLASEEAVAVRPVDGYYNCVLTVEKLHPDVTQLRLDFLHFEVRHCQPLFTVRWPRPPARAEKSTCKTHFKVHFGKKCTFLVHF